MSIDISGYSTISIPELQKRLKQIENARADVFQYFWISDAGDAHPAVVKRYQEKGFSVRSSFLVHRNDEDGNQYIREIPQIFYDSFGPGELRMYDNDFNYVPPRR